jgi:hypothetical protein
MGTSASGAARGDGARDVLAQGAAAISRAPAHKITRDNDFMDLSASLRNFFASGDSRSRPRRRGAARPSQAFEAAFGRGARKRKARFVMRNERFRDGGCKPLKSLGCEINDFAGSFVFNALTAFWFRAVRKRCEMVSTAPSRAALALLIIVRR